MNKPTTIRFNEQDRELIERVKDLYGCPSDVAAIRLALRLVTKLQFSYETTSRPHAPPQLGTPLLSPCLKAGVLRGGGDKRMDI
jgi:hypothetical protein